MPTYDYECQKCGSVFEVFQSMKDEPLKTCTEEGCNGKVKRLIGTGAGIIFKGSGFYETDYRSSDYKQAAKKDKDSSSSKPKEGGCEKCEKSSSDSCPAKS